MELLPDSDGAFVAICQDTSTSDETAYVVVGRANPSGPTITIYDSSAVLYAQTYSVNPSIVALSSNSFMIGYYNDPAKLFVAYGKMQFVDCFVDYMVVPNLRSMFITRSYRFHHRYRAENDPVACGEV